MSSIGTTIKGKKVSIADTVERPEPPRMRQSEAPPREEEDIDDDDEFVIAPPNENDLAPTKDSPFWQCCQELEPIANGEPTTSPPMVKDRILRYCATLIKHVVNYRRDSLLVTEADVRPYVNRCSNEFVTAFICADANRTVNNEYLELDGDVEMNRHVLRYLRSHPKMEGASISEFSNTKQYYVSKLVLASISKHMHMTSLILTQRTKRSVDVAEDAMEALVGALKEFSEKAVARFLGIIANNHVPIMRSPDGIASFPADTPGITPLDVALLEGNLPERFIRMVYDGIGIDRTKGQSPHKTFLSQLVRHYTPTLKFRSGEPEKRGADSYKLDVSVPNETIEKIAIDYQIRPKELLTKILNQTYKAKSDKDGADVPPRVFAHIVEKLRSLGITPYAQSMKILEKTLRDTKHYTELVRLLGVKKNVIMHVKQVSGDIYEATFNVIYRSITGTKAEIVDSTIRALSAA